MKLIPLNDSTFVYENAGAGDIDVTFSRSAEGAMRMVTRGADSPPFTTIRTGDTPAALVP